MAPVFSAICGAVMAPNVADWDQWSSGKAVISKPIVSYGDLVILYESYTSMQFVTVTRGAIHSSAKGHFHHDDFVGASFGSMIRARKGVSQARRPKAGGPVHAGWIVLLQPTPDLWTLSLNHRTQILYEADIAMVLLHLELKPGCVVVESGTGSCSLTTSLAQTVAPTGRVFTFEFNEERWRQASSDLRLLQLQELVTCTHRNVLAEGFTLPDLATADAVFLDLPSPWDAIAHADAVLRSSGKICSFSPCIEQVTRTCEVLRSHQFVEIVTLECLRRTFDAVAVAFPKFELDQDSKPAAAPHPVKRSRAEQAMTLDSPNSELVSKSFSAMRGHTGYLTFARKRHRSTSPTVK